MVYLGKVQSTAQSDAVFELIFGLLCAVIGTVSALSWHREV